MSNNSAVKFFPEILQDKTNGNNKFKASDWDGAITHYLEAILNIEDEKEKNPPQEQMNELKQLEIDCRNNLVICKSKQNDWYFVIIHSEAVLKLDPENKKASQKLGEGFYHMKKYDKAIELLNKAKVLNPDQKIIDELIEKSEQGLQDQKKEGKDQQPQYQNTQSFNNSSKYMMQ